MVNPNNMVSLVGRLTKPSQLYRPPQGTAYTFTNLAVQGKRKSNGDRSVQFFSCLLTGKNAENFVNYTDKGYLVSVSGELDVYLDNKDGQKNYKTRVKVDAFDILSRPSTAQTPAPIQERQAPPMMEQTSFFQGQSTQFQESYLEEPPFELPEDGM